MRLHQVTRQHPLRRARQVGRGGKRGKTAGRGTKGQKARAGHKIRPEFRDAIMKLPKQRGYQFQSFQTKPTVVNLGQLESAFSAGAKVTPESLLAAGLITKLAGRWPVVKLLGGGALTKALTVSGCHYSASAQTKIMAAGGRFE